MNLEPLSNISVRRLVGLGAMLAISFVLLGTLCIRSYSYLDRVAVGGSEGFCVGFLSGYGIFRVQVFPHIENQFFPPGFQSSPLEGPFRGSYLTAGYDGSISGAPYYYANAPWVLVAPFLWMAMIVICLPRSVWGSSSRSGK